MIDKKALKNGQFYWTDLTVDEPDTLKEFYRDLFGWQEIPVAMNDGTVPYTDYCMNIDSHTTGGGICHNRGSNKGIPPQWITYFYVEDIAESLATCIAKGGQLIKESRKKDGTYNYVIVADPLGSIFGMGNMQ